MEKKTYKLSRTVTFSGKEYNELTVDFDSLSGKDVRETKRYFDRPGRAPVMLMFDVEFASYLVAKASNVPYELMDNLSASDYLSISQAMINFLLSSGLIQEEARAMMEAKERAEVSVN